MSEEHQDFKWLALGAAQDLCGYEDMNKTLDECEQFIQSK